MIFSRLDARWGTERPSTRGPCQITDEQSRRTVVASTIMDRDQTTQLIRHLTLVYNADGGSLSAFADSARKVLQLGGCTLCSITHGVMGEKQDWRTCREALGVTVDVLHRDEIPTSLLEIVGTNLPCVVAATDEGPLVLLGPDVLARCRGSVTDFRDRLEIHAAMRSLSLGE